MPEFEGYTEASNYQIEEWVEGRPWHNPWAPDGSYGKGLRDGECCPDFSCCGAPLSPKEDRLAFAAAVARGDTVAQMAEINKFFRKWVMSVNKRLSELELHKGNTPDTNDN